MKKIKICTFICDITSGGVEAVLQNYFSHLDRTHYELDLVTYNVQSEICAQKFRNLGFRIITIPPKRDGFFRSLRAMNQIIHNGSYDVIHAHLTEWNCLPMLLGKKCHVTIRISHSHMAEFNLPLQKKLLLSLQRWIILHTSTKLCACGEAAGKYLYGQRLFDAGKVLVLYNAIERDRFLPDAKVREDVRAELGIHDDELCLGHIGRFLPQKNHKFLIHVFNELLKIHPKSVLILAGTGELENEIRKECGTFEIDNKVRFLGVRPDPERLYQAMDVFCLPSLFEGLPMVGIEVQAAQKPAILSDRISNKVKITDYVRFLSLETSAQKWAQEIMSVWKYKGNGNYPKEYDISFTAHEWEQLYII